MKEYGVRVGKWIEYFPEKIGTEVKITDGDVLHFPAMFLYDEFMQSDIVNDFPTNTTFRDQLKEILKEKAPWDESHWYNIDNVWIFYECNITENIDKSTKKVESKTKYKEVRLGDTLYEIITQPTFVMP